MNSEIRKIDSIKHMGVFQDFCWAKSVKSKDNKVAEFKKINILYGQNYSGKTTMSRIFRALENPSIISNYKYKTSKTSPKFQLSCGDGKKIIQDSLGMSCGDGKEITQESLDKCDQVVRVFNEDFVKDNLRFIFDDEQTIKSFAICR